MSKKDKAIYVLAAKIVSRPIDIDLVVDLDIELTKKQNLLFPTSTKSKFYLCTIDNSSTKRHSARFERQVVSVKKNGLVLLTSENKLFGSAGDFIYAYNPISPPSQDEFDKAVLINQMAHAWGLDGYYHLNHGLILEKAGSYAEHCIPTLLNHIDRLDFPEEFEHSLFNQDDFKKALKYAFEQSLELEALINQMRDSHQKWKKVQSKLLEMIDHSDNTDVPALIQSGERGHQTYMVYHNRCLAFTNRGERHQNNPSGTDYFKVDPERLKEKLCEKDFLRKFVGDTKESRFLKFQPYRKGDSFGGEITKQLKLVFLGFDPKGDLKVGNCAFSNLISALHSFAVMNVYHPLPDFPNEDIVQLANKTKIDHKAFTFAIRTAIVDHAARKFHAKDPQFASDYLTICNKMMTKIQNYEKERKFSRVEDRKKIIKLCQYYFEKLSINNMEMSAYYKLIDHIIRLHYPGITEEEALELLEDSESKWIIIHNETDNTYSIYSTDSKGSLAKTSLPDTPVSTIEEFTLRFPEYRRVSMNDLHPDSSHKVMLYQKIQLLSIGRVTSSEEQVLLQGESPGAWLVRDSFEERGQFAVTFVAADNQIKTWALSRESLSTTLDVFGQQFNPKNQVNPLSIVEKLNAFHSCKLKKTPLKFEKPVYLSGALKPFQPPLSGDPTVDDIVEAIGENLKSAMPVIDEIKGYLSALLSDDKFSPEEIFQIMVRLPVRIDEINHLLDLLITEKVEIEKFNYQRSLLMRAGVEIHHIERIFMSEDVAVGTWFIAPSDDDRSISLIIKLSDSEDPYMTQIYKPIDDETQSFIRKLISGKVTYNNVSLHTKLSHEKLPKIYQYQEISNIFTGFKMKSHLYLNRIKAESLLRDQSDCPPLALVRKSQSTPDAIVFCTLNSEGEFSERKYTREQFLDLGLEGVEERLDQFYECIICRPKDL